MTLPHPTELYAEPIVRSLAIDGKRFEVTLVQAGKACWRWCITAPDKLALSGEAESEIQALHLAGRAGRMLARLENGLAASRA